MSWCNVSDDEGDSPEFYEARIHAARKPYKCSECHEEIAKGERYEYAVGKWSGEIDTFHTCLMCVDIRRHFQPDGGAHGTLGDALNANLRVVKGWWLMDPKDKIIAGLVELVCELLEGASK